MKAIDFSQPVLHTEKTVYDIQFACEPLLKRIPMNFVFISPHFPQSYWNFCDRLKARGVNVLGIGDASYEALSPELRAALTEYYRVDSLEDYDQVYRAMAFFTFKHGRIDWVESNNEYWLSQDAHLRDDFNIKTGMSMAEVANVRRKSAMKQFYEKAGVPVARWHLIDTLEQGKNFAHEVGYPVFVKPDGGMGASGSYRIANDEEMEQFYARKENVPYIMEEYLSGDIWSYDGVSDSRANVIFETCTSWPPSIAEIVNNKDHLAYYTASNLPEDLKEAGRRTISAFNVRSRFFHLEFFRLREDKKGLARKGELVALEVNMRPAGGWTPDMFNYANSVDVYSIWADMVVHDKTYVDLDKQKYFAVYAGRRNGKPYVHTPEEVRARYGGRIVMDLDIPPAISGAMGDHQWTAMLDTAEQKDEFIQFVQETF